MASYIDGNVVRKEVEPAAPERERKVRRVNRRLHKNRANAVLIGKSYVAFLAAAAAVAVISCVCYLSLQAKVDERVRNISRMQTELEEMTEENNSRYKSIVSSMNLEEIREKAVNDLGMQYARPGQVIHYRDPLVSKFTKFADIPESAAADVSER